MSPDRSPLSADIHSIEIRNGYEGIDYVVAVLDVFGHGMAMHLADSQLGMCALTAERELGKPFAEPKADLPDLTPKGYATQLIRNWIAIRASTMTRLDIREDEWQALMLRLAPTTTLPLLTLRIRPACAEQYPRGLMLTGALGSDFPDDALIATLRYRARIIADTPLKNLTHRTAVYVPRG